MPLRTIGADQGPGHGQVAEASPDERAFRPCGDVEDLVAVALEHCDLLGTGVVREANDLFSRQQPGIDRDVDAGSFEDVR